jgi:probable rRNA maturation factor
MIAVESDVSGDWDSRTDWRTLAAEAVRAAFGASAQALLLESAITVEISVKFGSDEDVQALNAAWRDKDRPTNVLSFPMVDAERIGELGRAGGGEALLGDIVLARGVCTREAVEKGVPIEAHAAHLIVHGTLHLLGYDHETAEADAEAMEEMERRALAAIGIADPYVSEVQSQEDA